MEVTVQSQITGPALFPDQLRDGQGQVSKPPWGWAIFPPRSRSGLVKNHKETSRFLFRVEFYPLRYRCQLI